MKKKLLNKFILMTFAASAVFGTYAPVYADENNTEIVSETDEISNEEKIMINHDLSNFIFYKGTVTSVQNNAEDFITILLGDTILRANIPNDTVVIDVKDGSVKSVSDIKKDMNVMVMLGKNTPMTMSIPPMTSSVSAVLINTEDTNIDFSVYNEELVNAENTLKIKIGEDTVLTDINGNAVNAENIPGHTCVVFYGASTRSIPAQTTPESVIVIENVEVSDTEAEEESDDLISSSYNSEETVNKNPLRLRETSEKAGYTVKWVSNNEPVLISKEGKEIIVAANSDEVTINGVKAKLSDKIYLDSYDRMIAPYDFADIL